MIDRNRSIEIQKTDEAEGRRSPEEEGLFYESNRVRVRYSHATELASDYRLPHPSNSSYLSKQSSRKVAIKELKCRPVVPQGDHDAHPGASANNANAATYGTTGECASQYLSL
jgi:hypothetical protein